MQVLITGGSGFIGSNLYNALWMLDDPEPLVPTKEELDITNSRQVDDYFREHQPDVVVHLAAQSNVVDSIDDPVTDAKINIGGTINLVHASERAWTNVKKFIYASSVSIYGEGLNHMENEVPHPRSPYSISKLTGEYYVRRTGITFTILRLSNVYGSGADRVINKFIGMAKENIEPIMYGKDDRSLRDYIYVDDVVNAIKLMIFNDHLGTFNVCTGIPTSLMSLWNMICDIYGKKIEPMYSEPRLGELIWCVGCPDKLQELTGFEPKYSLSEGIRKIKEIEKNV
jgi:UDP-glucose 4-epimerase